MPSKLRGPLYMLLAAGAIVSLLALGYVVGKNIGQNRSEIKVACGQVQKLEVVIRSVLQQSLQTLGQKGSAGYSYYLVHPAELATTRDSLKHEITRFSEQRC